jgi:hypothetical protein
MAEGEDRVVAEKVPESVWKMVRTAALEAVGANGRRKADGWTGVMKVIAILSFCAWAAFTLLRDKDKSYDGMVQLMLTQIAAQAQASERQQAAQHREHIEALKEIRVTMERFGDKLQETTETVRAATYVRAGADVPVKRKAKAP